MPRNRARGTPDRRGIRAISLLDSPRRASFPKTQRLGRSGFRKPPKPGKRREQSIGCIYLTMKNLMSSVWRLLIRATSRKHDPFLVYSITSFNSGGGWKEFLLKASLQNT